MHITATHLSNEKKMSDELLWNNLKKKNALCNSSFVLKYSCKIILTNYNKTLK